jgi:alkanesulfonate monooxygenase SsuD/methylene tetrahydromethanopterin reductase-like flavin-dependent oxidoreductase (luciferase family)
MLEITLPHVQQWNVWYRQTGNTPAGLRPILAQVDEACRAVGRDPQTLEKTCAAFVGMPGGGGRLTKYDDREVAAPAFEGSPAELASWLREYADLGIAEVQLVVDPITIESIHALAPMLAELDRG